MSSNKDYSNVFARHPRLEGEELNPYFRRLASLKDVKAELDGNSWNALKTWYYRHVYKDVGDNQQSFPPSIVTQSEPEKPLHDRLHIYILKNRTGHSHESLSDYFNVGIGRIKEALEILKGQGKNIRITPYQEIELSSEVEREAPTLISNQDLHFKFGVIADNHLCSKYAREEIGEKLYDIFEREGITTCYQLGNMIDGEARFNKHDLLVSGLGGQVNYFIDKFPQRKGITTYFITGDDHEGWYTQREGINIGRFMMQEAQTQGRNDLIYVGHMEHDIIMKQANGVGIMKLIHAGGGSSYATSYTSQKYVESLQAGEKPHIVLVGHFHKFDYCYPREVHVVQAGCVQDQSPFMRKKKIAAHVGGLIIEGWQRTDGSIERLKVEWIPFYDKGYYDKAWKYRFE